MTGPAPTRRSELGELAERLAREGGEIARRGRTDLAARRSGDTKSSTTDVVTEYDRAAETHIVGELRRVRPDDAIIGEEGTADGGTSGFAWHIDPIDGTTNFVYDQPAWACSVAVEHTGTMLAGAVFAPVLAEMFTAVLDGGARCNGQPISVTGATDLTLALLGTGFAYQPAMRIEQARTITGLIGQVRDIRRLGSAAFDLCMVACGRLDIYFERNLNSWDAAAGELIAREAGAITSDFTGGPTRLTDLVAATPALHGPFLAAYQAALGSSPGAS